MSLTLRPLPAARDDRRRSLPRCEAAIRRKIFSAVTEADNLLRDLYERQVQVDKDAIRRVRGLLAGWRLESD